MAATGITGCVGNMYRRKYEAARSLSLGTVGIGCVDAAYWFLSSMRLGPEQIGPKRIGPKRIAASSSSLSSWI